MKTNTWEAFRGFIATVCAFKSSPYRIRQHRDGRFSVYDRNTGKLVRRAHVNGLRQFAIAQGILQS
jgi:hypothetical protein